VRPETYYRPFDRLHHSLNNRPVSERPAWGWTTLAMLLTNSWFLSETGRKRPPANVAGAQIGAASRTRRAKQRRGSR